MKKFLKNWKWYEILFLAVSWIILICCFAFSPEKNWLSLASSILGVFTVITVAKGLVYAPIMCIVNLVFYVAISVTEHYWGEVLINVCLILPVSISTIVSWFKNRSKENKDIVKVNRIGGKEYGLLILGTAVITIAFYFLLRALNTNELIVSTISLVTSALAEYLLLRRCPFYALAYAGNDVVLIVLWGLSVANHGLQFLPLVICYCVYLFGDFYGFFKWCKEYRKQNKNQQSQIEENINQ